MTSFSNELGGVDAPPTDRLTGEAARIARIRLLNDMLRQGYPTGEVMVTRAVQALPEIKRSLLLLAVQRFEKFDAANDPYGEHDFGSVEFDGEVWFWKIDAYDVDRNHASPDPTDPDVTCRVLTIMRADEY